MRYFLLLVAVAAVIRTIRSPDARSSIAGSVRAGAVLAGFVQADFGTLQREVLVGARRQRTVAVNKTTRLASTFSVTFASSDRAIIEPVEDAFFADVAEVLIADAARRDWVLDATPRFTATYSDAARPGFPSVTAVAPRLVAARPVALAVVDPEATQSYAESPATAAAPMPTDVRRLVDDHERVVSLRSRQPVTLGRDQRSDVVVDDPTVSSRHAQVVCGPSGWTVVDCGSTNGTYVNDAAAATATPIRVGDIVRLGPEVTFRVSA